tara:strand:+ start:1842 stop:2585 length:744 start_codon:yes stop_codon:yes gene_type:complete
LITVYTCIAGNYDNLIEQPFFDDVKYICFSDLITHQSYKNWLIVPIDLKSLNQPNLVNRHFKTSPFDLSLDNEYSLYIDGNVLLKEDPKLLLSHFSNTQNSIAAFKHPVRSTVKEEMQELVVTGKLINQEVLKANSFLNKIDQEGFDFTSQLTAGYILLRRHDDMELIKAMQEWLQIILTTCKRDQLSLQYVLWKHNLEISYLDDFCEPDSFFKRINHGLYISWMPLAPQDFIKKISAKFKSLLFMK